MRSPKLLIVLIGLLVFCALLSAQAPWLPEEDQKTLRALIPEGVPFSSNARFYKLRQVYQSIYFLNGHEQRDIVPVTTEEHPWKVSGGMHWSSPAEWRNVTALDIPAGKKILLWSRYVDAGAPGPVAKIEWRFPVGTIAYDVLIRRGSPERVFEVRTHERGPEGWIDATTYRPDVPTEEAKDFSHTWSFANNVIFDGFTQRVVINAQGTVKMVAPIKTPVRFVPRKDLPHDGGFLIPKNYVGAGTSCLSCHSNALVGHRTGYGTAIRGGDGRFSWHPFAADGSIDWRWPMEVYKR